MSPTTINKGIDVLSALSSFDIGQAIVVQEGVVLGIEAIEGTKQLLERIKIYSRPQQDRKGVLVKIPKRGQTHKVDLPTIGPDTLRSVALSGLRGLAIDASGVNVLHSDSLEAECNNLGIFLYAFDDKSDSY